MNIGVDCDDVLRDFTGALINVLDTHYPGKFRHDKIPTWNLDHIDLPYDEIKKMWSKTYAKEILTEAPLCDGAKRGYELLREFCDKDGHRLTLISYQTDLTRIPTLEYLNKHGFLFDEYIFTQDKHKCDIKYLIDDSAKFYDAWISNYRDKGKFILINKPNNLQIFHDIRADNLLEAAKYIIKKSG